METDNSFMDNKKTIWKTLAAHRGLRPDHIYRIYYGNQHPLSLKRLEPYSYEHYQQSARILLKARLRLQRHRQSVHKKITIPDSPMDTEEEELSIADTLHRDYPAQPTPAPVTATATAHTEDMQSDDGHFDGDQFDADNDSIGGPIDNYGDDMGMDYGPEREPLVHNRGQTDEHEAESIGALGDNYSDDMEMDYDDSQVDEDDGTFLPDNYSHASESLVGTEDSYADNMEMDYPEYPLPADHLTRDDQSLDFHDCRLLREMSEPAPLLRNVFRSSSLPARPYQTRIPESPSVNSPNPRSSPAPTIPSRHSTPDVTATNLKTPSATPERSDISAHTLNGTPSVIGDFLKSRAATLQPQPPLYGLETWLDRESIANRYKIEMRACGKEANDRLLQERVVHENVNRFMVLANLVTVSPPHNVDNFSKLQKVKIKLMFSNDVDDISKHLGISLQQYMAQYRLIADSVDNASSVSLHLAARFSTLNVLDNNVIGPPRNMCWWFMFLHQLTFQQLAIRYPASCGFENCKTQNIEAAVNKDLLRLCTVALNKEISKTTLKGLKRSASIFLRLYCSAINFLSQLEEVPMDQRFFYSTLMTSVMYQNICSQDGFGSFQTYGTISKSVRDGLERQMFDCIQTHWNQLSNILQQWHQDVTPENIQPFVTSSEPNVISFLHLIAQSINDEWPAVTYEMIETVLELPQGYFTKYVPTTSPPGLLNALKAVPQWFRDVWNA